MMAFMAAQKKILKLPSEQPGNKKLPSFLINPPPTNLRRAELLAY
jgi:hypothetical protein